MINKLIKFTTIVRVKKACNAEQVYFAIVAPVN